MADYYAVVEGLTLPACLSGHPALDFCNTRAGWAAPAVRDYLESYDHLVVWAGSAGLLEQDRVSALRAEAASRPRAAAAALAQARATRDELYRVLMGSDAELDAIAAPMRAATRHLRLARRGGAIIWEIDPEAGLLSPLLATVWSAGELIVSADRARVEACPGEDCGWLFVNRSGRRRWCTMSTCGNRAKARRFADRHRP
jgi:predicted RNA-binding Zn ribbon-like protein